MVVSLLTLDCDSLNDLTINVSQDALEIDMDTAYFVSDGGSFTISTMSVGDIIGFASLVTNTNTYSTNLLVSSIVSSNQAIIESIEISSGLVLGTFDISNNISGGISVTAFSPSDGNTYTLNGNSSSVTFTNVFLNPTASILNFTSNIVSELGDVDTQSFSFNIVCQCITQYIDVFISSCDDFIWDGVVYDSTANYINTYSDTLGCDSVVTLNLTIINSSSDTFNIIECDQYIWDSIVYDSTGLYTNVYAGSNGCDSLITLNLTINNVSIDSLNILSCDNFTWDGVVYDSTGLYTNIYTDLNGCDSSMTLNLTINNSSLDSLDIISCGDFLWDGVVYDSTGFYTNTYTDLNGCDSIVTINLIIDNIISVVDTLLVCDSLVWNGNIYYLSGNYTDTFPSISACDSIVTINLTIYNSSSSTVFMTSCDSYLWNGKLLSSSGIYDTVLTNILGCDSIEQIYLTIVPSVFNSINIHACGEFYWNGNYLDSSDVYIDTLSANNGCDSIVILNLIITPNIELTCINFNVDCYGNASGEIDLSITEGSAPFSFVWSNGSNLEDLSNLFGDSIYSCTITDSAFCTLDTSFYISQPTILEVTENLLNVSCFDGNDGNINLNIFGGTFPYFINWPSTDTFNLSAGFYSYEISDSNGCIIIDSALITQPDPILFNVNALNVSCFGESTGSLEISVLIGSGVFPYSYEWTGPNLFSSSQSNIYNLFAGDYYLTITDGNNCIVDTFFTLTEPINLPLITNIQISNYNGYNIGCKGDSSGWVSVLVNGGYGPHTYLWSNFSTSDSIFNLTSGIYNLELTDSLGCIIIFDFPIIEPANIVTSSIISTTDYNGYNISCFSFNDGALLGLANGGVPPYSYSWNTVLLNDSITNLYFGDYQLTVNDINNCSSTSLINLTEPDSLYLDIITVTDTCSKGVGQSTVTSNGGVPAYTYSWSDGSNSSTVSNFYEGIYEVIVTDANLCQVSDSIEILNLPSPLIDFGIFPDNQRLFDQIDDPIVFIDFTNPIWQSIISWDWDFDDGSFGIDSIAYHSFADTGVYIIMLTTISEYNCIDTITKKLTITDYSLYIPNSFTPFSSNDNINNIFKAYGVGVKNFKMEIYSRWGERIFQSNSLNLGWDGTSYKGSHVPVGIYIYLIETQNIYGEIFKYNGQVKLIR